jgi:hypothetical protein
VPTVGRRYKHKIAALSVLAAAGWNATPCVDLRALPAIKVYESANDQLFG